MGLLSLAEGISSASGIQLRAMLTRYTNICAAAVLMLCRFKDRSISGRHDGRTMRGIQGPFLVSRHHAKEGKGREGRLC